MQVQLGNSMKAKTKTGFTYICGFIYISVMRRKTARLLSNSMLLYRMNHHQRFIRTERKDKSITFIGQMLKPDQFDTHIHAKLQQKQQTR